MPLFCLSIWLEWFLWVVSVWPHRHLSASTGVLPSVLCAADSRLHLFLILCISSHLPAWVASALAVLSSVSTSACFGLFNPFHKYMNWTMTWPLVLPYCPIINGQHRLFWWNFVSWQCRRHTGLPPPSLEHGFQAVTLSSVQPLWIQLYRYFTSLCLVTL